MSKLSRLTVPLLAVLALAGCGGSSHPAHPIQAAHHTPYGLEAHSPTFGLPPKGIALPRVAAAGVPTLTMLDSVESSLSIFAGLNPTVTAGYTSGSWPTFFDYRGHYPYVVAVMVNTSHFGEHGAARSCLDIEPGDASPSEAGAWVLQEIHRGFQPCVYGSLSEYPAINASISAAHVHVHVFRWDADWTFSPHLDSGFDATQWTDRYANRNIDGSTVTWAFVGKTTTPPPPKPKHVCFGKHWQHGSYCNRVRQQDAGWGRSVRKQGAYAKVSQANIARYQRLLGVAQGRLKVETGKLDRTRAALARSLVANGCRDAGHGRIVCR